MDTAAMDCLFCRIVDHAAEASIVHEDDRVIAFCDLFPVNPGHLLVAPKVHATGLGDLDELDGRQMFAVGQRLAGAIRATGPACEGINFFVADGAAAGQEVFHVHLHVIPRYVGDGVRLSFGQSRTPTSRDELDVVAGRIRAAR
jgi:diadenosine tetraphosphate (Ap4A) HIT family hydrolase